MRSGERSLQSELLADHCRADFVQSEPAVLLGDVDREQAELAGLLHQLAMDRIVLGVDRIFARNDFFAQELFGGAREHSLLFADVFRDEDVFRGDGFDEKASAFWRGRLFGLARHRYLLL